MDQECFSSCLQVTESGVWYTSLRLEAGISGRTARPLLLLVPRVSASEGVSVLMAQELSRLLKEKSAALEALWEVAAVIQERPNHHVSHNRNKTQDRHDPNHRHYHPGCQGHSGSERLRDQIRSASPASTYGSMPSARPVASAKGATSRQLPSPSRAGDHSGTIPTATHTNGTPGPHLENQDRGSAWSVRPNASHRSPF